MMMSHPNREIAVVHRTNKDGEAHTFAFVCTLETRAAALRELGKIASNPELPFTWYDAAIVSQEIRNQAYDLENPPAVVRRS